VPQSKLLQIVSALLGGCFELVLKLLGLVSVQSLWERQWSLPRRAPRRLGQRVEPRQRVKQSVPVDWPSGQAALKPPARSQLLELDRLWGAQRLSLRARSPL
jgi:hypothetical protein